MMFDMGVPTCALRLLRSYLTNRSMRVHLNDAVSDMYELWGGGPQGGLLTVLLFNLYSNWITDVCEPGLSQADRFLLHGPVVAPRCSFAQLRDCPPDTIGSAGLLPQASLFLFLWAYAITASFPPTQVCATQP